ncbi:distal tail protein Dit [Streptococcus hyovaginalis]
MYDYYSLQKTDKSDSFVPSDNMSINGIPLNELVEGYMHLTVTGRGIIGQRIETEGIRGRRGVWVDDVSDPERELEIKYRLQASTSEELRERFAKLNKVLRTESDSGYLEITFKDEPDYVYYGFLVDADSIEETNLSPISKFTLLIPDGYKKKKAQSSTGLISLVDASQVLPDKIVVQATGTVNQIQIINGNKILDFKGSYASGTDIIITYDSDEVTATYGGRNMLSELQLYSPLETFYLKNGDTVTVKNGTLKQITWRDERL